MKVKSAVAAFLIFLIVLGIYIYIEYFPHGESELRSNGENIPLLRFDPKMVTFFEITQGELYLKVIRDSRWEWAIIKKDGTKIPADPEIIEALIANLGTFDSIKEVAKDKKSIDNFGLTTKTISTIKLELDKKSPIAIIFGADNPIHTGVYTMIDTKPGVYLCETAVSEKFLKQINELRDYRLAKVDKEKVDRIIIKSEVQELEIIKKEEQWYVQVEGALKEADPDLVDTMLQKVTSLKGYQSADDNPLMLDKYGLSRPNTIINMREPEKEHLIRFGKVTDDSKSIYTYSDFSPVVFLVDMETYDYLNKSPSDVRNRLPNRFKAMFIDKIEIRKGDLILELEKNLDLVEWNFTKPIHCPADIDMIAELLHDLEIAKGEKILEVPKEGLEDYGLTKPELSINLFDQKDKKEYGFFFGRQLEGDLTACMNSKRAEIFLVPSKTMSHIPRDIFKGLRDKVLSRIKTYTSNHIIYSSSNKFLECKMDSDGQWRGVKPKIKKLDNNLSRMLNEIDSLKIEDFVDDNPTDLSIYGLKTPQAYIQLSDASKVLEKICIGNKRDDKDEVFVKIEAVNSVYTIKRSVFEKIQKEAEQIIGMGK